MSKKMNYSHEAKPGQVRNTFGTTQHSKISKCFKFKNYIENKKIIILLVFYICFLSLSNPGYCQPYLSNNINNLIAELGDDDKGFDAQIKLQNIGKPAVDPLLKALQSADITTKRRIIIILGEIGDKKAIKPLIDIYNSRADLKIKLEAESSLRHLGLNKSEIGNWTENGSDISQNSITQTSPDDDNESDSPESNYSYLLGLIIFIIVLSFIIQRYLSSLNDKDELQIDPIIAPSTRIWQDDNTVESDIPLGEIITFQPIQANPESYINFDRSGIRKVGPTESIPEVVICAICGFNMQDSRNEFGGAMVCTYCGVWYHKDHFYNDSKGKCQCRRR